MLDPQARRLRLGRHRVARGLDGAAHPGFYIVTVGVTGILFHQGTGMSVCAMNQDVFWRNSRGTRNFVPYAADKRAIELKQINNDQAKCLLPLA